MTLTKNDIVKRVNELGFTKKQSGMLVEMLLEAIKASLENGEDVLVSGFGKFCVMDKSERRGRNPVTGDEVMLRQRRVVTFRCSKKLRDLVNNGQR